MSVKEQAKQVFEYISHVLAITPENLWVQPEPQSTPLSTVETDVVSIETTAPVRSAAAEDDSFASVQDEDTPDRLGAALAYAQRKAVDIRDVSLAEIKQALVALLRQENKQPLSRDNVAGRVCRKLGFRPPSRSKEMFERKVDRALQHLIDRETIEVDELGTIRFAFQNNVERQRELDLGKNA
ncbi:MAG: hypothetical protein ABIH24_07725 [Verrucomicrobiota bacterium]